MKKILILSLVLIMFLTVSCAVEKSSDNKPKKELLTPIIDEIQIEEETSTVKEFKMTAKNWEFIPSEIRVQEGQKVRLLVTSPDVEHSLAISEYGINEHVVPGEETVIEFTADKIGTFTMSCRVFCGEGHKGMKGSLVVS